MSSEGYNSDLVSLSVTYYTCIILVNISLFS